MRRLFTILSVTSLVLCVGTCVLWLRSCRVSESFAWFGPRVDGSLAVDWSLGIVRVVRAPDNGVTDWGGVTDFSYDAAAPPRPLPLDPTFLRETLSAHWKWGGLLYGTNRGSPGSTLVIPFAWLAVATALLPMARLVRWARRRGDVPPAAVPPAATTCGRRPGGAPSAGRSGDVLAAELDLLGPLWADFGNPSGYVAAAVAEAVVGACAFAFLFDRLRGRRAWERWVWSAALLVAGTAAFNAALSVLVFAWVVGGARGG